MGKSKQALRTKNNAKPSNSSRSAEFLGTTTQNLVGFSALKDAGFTPSSIIKDGGGYQSLLPSLSISTISDVDMKNIDPKFHLVLKKMNKKDSTTKCKALQEFIELCRDSEQSSIEGLLPFWSRLYGQLANDIEHKVREITQLAHAAVVKRAGKNIAVHLKQLAGPWFISQYDTFPPAASAALNSFNETFPPIRVVNAIIHCQEEILKYIWENLTSIASQSQLKKSLTAEELEAKHQRLVVSSLQSYSFYLKTVPFAEIEKTIEIHRTIFGRNSKYWKFGNHESVAIKTAFFNVLSSVIENAVKLLENEKKRAMMSIINSLDETDPGLLSAIWEAMLIAVTKLENWFQVVNIEKFVLPKLWHVLKNGSHCCPTIMYPNLLPFLGQFPKFNLNSKELFSNFFNNMREGFSEKNIKLTYSETFAIVTSFVECLRYAVIINYSNQDICLSLLKEQLIPMIEFSLKESIPYNKILFLEISQLIRYWTKQSSECSTYFQLVNNFWIELDVIFEKLSISEDESLEEERVSSIFNSQIDFLLALKNYPLPKPSRRVKFSDDSNTEVGSKTENLILDDDRQFLMKLENFIHALSISYFNKINSDSPKKNIQRFVKLVLTFETKEVFITLSKSLKDNVDLMSFYQCLKSWLGGKKKETQATVQLIFSLLKYMEETNQEMVLNSILELNNSLVLKNAVLCALSKQNRNNKVIKSWCANFNVGLILKEVAESIVNLNSTDIETNEMILLAFETTDDGVPLFSSEAINALVATLASSLNKPETNSKLVANLISQILEITCTYTNLSDSSLISAICFMLEKLFEFSIETEMKKESIRSTWKRNISRVDQIIPHSCFLDFVRNLANILWKKMFKSNFEDEMNFEIEIATDFIESVIESSRYCETEKNKEMIKLFLTELDLRNWIINFSGIVLYAEVVTGNLYKPCLRKKQDKNKEGIQDKEEIRIWEDFITFDLNDNFVDYSENSLKWVLFTTKLLNNLLLRTHDEDREEDSRSFESIILSNFLEVFFNVIYVFTLGNTYRKYYKSTKHYTKANSLLDEISKEFSILKGFFTIDIRKEIGNFFNNNVHDKILPHLLHVYHTEFEPDVTPSMYFKNYENILSTEENKRISYIRGVEIMPQYFEDEKILGALNFEVYSSEEALILARSKLTNRTQDLKLIEVLDLVMKSSKGNPCSSLYDKVISEFDSDVSLTLEIVNSFTKLVSTFPTKLTTDHWDLIMTSMVELEVSILQTMTWYQTRETFFYPMQVSSLIIAVSKLYSAVQTLMNKHEKEPISGLPPELLDEWKNVFLIHTQAGIAQIWVRSSETIAEIYDKSTSSPTNLILLNTLGIAIKLLDGRIFCQKQEDESRINSLTSNQVILSSLKLLTSPVHNLQLGGYYMLNHLIPELIECDKASILVDNFESKSLNLAKFVEILSRIENIVKTILMDFKLCDTISCTIQPYTDSYTYTLGYLLTWSVLLKMCAEAHGDLRYQYAEILKDKYFPCFMESIFKLMPVELLQDKKAKSSKLFEIFATKPSLGFSESWTEWRLDHIACWLYSNCLRYLPVLVRQWWSTTDSRVSAAIDKITSIYVSPMLCQEELQSNKFVNIENMQVKVLPSAREVIALYQMDETKLELSIVLPTNHPLGAVTITPCQYVGGTANWRNCHMQLSILLTHQNGSLWDGLMLWKTNLDKRFAGIEECCICFSVFHISTYQIPKSSCHTCRKKFHTSCLYKWFNTSQKSSCPICRNVF